MCQKLAICSSKGKQRLLEFADFRKDKDKMMLQYSQDCGCESLSLHFKATAGSLLYTENCTNVSDYTVSPRMS